MNALRKNSAAAILKLPQLFFINNRRFILMKNHKTTNRVLAALLAVLMSVSLFPSAFAAESEVLIRTADELLELAAELGADVPFCMTCGTVLCKGIGEKLTPIASFPKKHILLVKPPVGISTADIYAKIDSEPCEPHPTTAEFIASVGENCYDKEKMFNVMEKIVAAELPVIRGIKEKLIKNGAETAMMSGSGSTVFGIFSDFEAAKKSADSFSYFYKDVFLTKSI